MLKFRLCKYSYLENDDKCLLDQFVVIRNSGSAPYAIGRAMEMLQVDNSLAELERRPSLFLILLYTTSDIDMTTLMPILSRTGRYMLVDYKV